MTNREISVIEFIYARMIRKHGENKNIDYMIALKNIIDNETRKNNPLKYLTTQNILNIYDLSEND